VAKLAKASLTALVVAVVLAVSGCTINFSPFDMRSGMNPNNDMNRPGSSSSEFSGVDIMFAQMMIPHHQQAIELSELAFSQSQNPQILELANQIKLEQGPEIEQMTLWLENSKTSGMMDHQHGDMGMLSDEELRVMAETQGDEFDRLFLIGMIAHHEGAIDMAQMIVNSSNIEAKALAKAIIESQTEQIKYMKTLLASF
jgi:uncharacterized protein (DUF305 family)